MNTTTAPAGPVASAAASTPALRSLMTKDVVLRAAIIALALGTVLVLANQPEAIFGDGQLQLLPLVLVYVTPFVVVVVSQLLGIRRAVADARGSGASRTRRTGFLATLVTHGIPLRAILLGLVVGTVNTCIVALAQLAQRGDLAALPTSLIGQAFVLPMLFGLLSQAISYRRATARLRENA